MGKNRTKKQLVVGCLVSVTGGEYRYREGTVRKIVGSPHEKGIAQSIFVDISGVVGTVEVPQHYVTVKKMPATSWRPKQAYEPRSGPEPEVSPEPTSGRKPKRTPTKDGGAGKKRPRKRRRPAQVDGMEIPPPPGRYAGKRPKNH